MEAKYVMTRSNKRSIFGRRYILSNQPRTANEWINYIQAVLDGVFDFEFTYKKFVVSYQSAVMTSSGREKIILNILNTETHEIQEFYLYEDMSIIDARNINV